MSEVKKIATRDSYGDALVELGKEHDNLVVLDADLAAATKTGKFKAAFPERFIDCGIAECNMVGIAAGMSTAVPTTLWHMSMPWTVKPIRAAQGVCHRPV